MRHVDPSNIPYYCNLCGFRGSTRKQFDLHLTKSALHKKLTKNENTCPEYLSEGTPYNVTWGSPNSDLLMGRDKKTKEMENSEDVLDLVDPDMDIEFREVNDVGVQTEETSKDDSLEVENLHLGNYIIRLEERIDHLVKELREVKEENRKLERFAPEGVTDYGIVEFEHVWEEEDRKRKMRSVVCAVSKKQRLD
jgi:hypothetical protein